ncbi:hypothetical protein [Ornithinimicrobium cavernae]|uniref:hypothetical protein n=1 Tax=Ornithinimicrobium cavernae TaxID=2666047 RepID=UPI0012B16F19|nr:hypothetical protein [Ornithinimicrobium cavernae]
MTDNTLEVRDALSELIEALIATQVCDEGVAGPVVGIGLVGVRENPADATVLLNPESATVRQLVADRALGEGRGGLVARRPLGWSGWSIVRGGYLRFAR